MNWVSHWDFLTGANDDGILFGTQNSDNAGNWADEPISHAWPYICEKNDQ